MAGDIAHHRRWQLRIEFFGGSSHTQGCDQSIVIAVGELLRHNVDAELVGFDQGDGQQDSALP
jgi:hypothetical protein